MSETVLVDAGPLVSYLVRAAEHHEWVCEHWKRLAPPLYTCEPVLAEAAHLLRRERQRADALLELLEVGVLKLAFSLNEHIPALKHLLRRYKDVPMSIADACLVRMSEVHERCLVMTTDSDFHFYRRHGRQVVPVLMPAPT